MLGLVGQAASHGTELREHDEVHETQRDQNGSDFRAEQLHRGRDVRRRTSVLQGEADNSSVSGKRTGSLKRGVRRAKAPRR